MYLHFEDWSSPIFLRQLKAKGIPHGEKIIKVFASEKDPRISLEKELLVVLKIDGHPFKDDEIFDFKDRGKYSGKMLEEKLSTFNLPGLDKSIVRALFRFAAHEGFTQTAMETKRSDGCWLIDHPFADIDGVETVQKFPNREGTIHLDIFFPQSLDHLQKIVDFTDSRKIATLLEGQRSRMKREGQVEGQNSGRQPER